MPPLSSSNEKSARPLMRRLDRAFGEINVVLLALAIGLAALDFTCFVTLRGTAEIARAQLQLTAATMSTQALGGGTQPERKPTKTDSPGP
jgi:hypothetical protein